MYFDFLSALFLRTLRADYLELKENAASYSVQREGERVYLLFEKSNGAIDWKNNLDFPAKAYREMQDTWFVHRGFLRVFNTVKEQIAPIVQDQRVKSMILSGYSHGAALALLAHEYCVFHRPDLAKRIYGFGFGCPRVVWGGVPQKVKERFARFTVIRNDLDVVTHLPPALLGYRHVGNMLKIGRGARYGPIDSHRAESYLAELIKRKGEKKE